MQFRLVLLVPSSYFLHFQDDCTNRDGISDDLSSEEDAEAMAQRILLCQNAEGASSDNSYEEQKRPLISLNQAVSQVLMLNLSHFPRNFLLWIMCCFSFVFGRSKKPLKVAETLIVSWNLNWSPQYIVRYGGKFTGLTFLSLTSAGISLPSEQTIIK